MLFAHFQAEDIKTEYTAVTSQETSMNHDMNHILNKFVKYLSHRVGLRPWSQEKILREVQIWDFSKLKTSERKAWDCKGNVKKRCRNQLLGCTGREGCWSFTQAAWLQIMNKTRTSPWWWTGVSEDPALPRNVLVFNPKRICVSSEFLPLLHYAIISNHTVLDNSSELPPVQDLIMWSQLYFWETKRIYRKTLTSPDSLRHRLDISIYTSFLGRSSLNAVKLLSKTAVFSGMVCGMIRKHSKWRVIESCQK